MSSEKYGSNRSNSAAGTAAQADLGRDARRLLLALAQEGAAPARSDLRDGFLTVAAPRNGVTSIVANAPLAAGAQLAARGLARWAGQGDARRLMLTDAGAALARRLAAPDADSFAAQHRSVVRRSPAPGEAAVAINECESPIAWLARRRGKDGVAFLDTAQVDAGERFRTDATIAQLLPRVTTQWSGVAVSGGRGPQNMHVSELAVAARQRIDRAATAVGPDLSGLLIDVCGFQKGLELVERERAWPPRAAKIVLRIALDRLAAHYGLSTAARGPAQAKKMRSWGADGYRPDIG